MAQTPITDLEELADATGPQLYDFIMETIEPELVTQNLPHLDDAYVNESGEARAARYERYSAAYDEYDRRFAEWSDYMQAKVNAYKRTALSSAEAESRQEDAGKLTSIESAFSLSA